MEETKQMRHEKLVDTLLGFNQYKSGSLKKVKVQRDSDSVAKIDSNEINHAVIAFTDILNIGGGSIGDIDLYRLLQAYLGDPDSRKEFNKLVNETLNRRHLAGKV